MRSAITLLLVGIIAVVAFSPAQAPALQQGPVSGLLGPVPCNAMFCNGADQQCWGPALTHCVTTRTYELVKGEDGRWRFDRENPVVSCQDFPCSGGFAQF